jgi:hypothetical protein
MSLGSVPLENVFDWVMWSPGAEQRDCKGIKRLLVHYILKAHTQTEEESLLNTSNLLHEVKAQPFVLAVKGIILHLEKKTSGTQYR